MRKCYAVFVALLLAAPAQAAQLGIYEGPGCMPPKVNAFASWLGRKPDRISIGANISTWANYDSDAAFQIASCAKSFPTTPLAVAVPLMSQEAGQSLMAAAQGAYDSHFQKTAAALVGRGFASAIIRIGWEQNGTWYPWGAAAHNDPQGYIA